MQEMKVKGLPGRPWRTTSSPMLTTLMALKRMARRMARKRRKRRSMTETPPLWLTHAPPAHNPLASPAPPVPRPHSLHLGWLPSCWAVRHHLGTSPPSPPSASHRRLHPLVCRRGHAWKTSLFPPLIPPPPPPAAHRLSPQAPPPQPNTTSPPTVTFHLTFRQGATPPPRGSWVCQEGSDGTPPLEGGGTSRCFPHCPDPHLPQGGTINVTFHLGVAPGG